MPNSINIIGKPDEHDISSFNKAKPKVYYGSTTTRTFQHGEAWYIMNGAIDLIGVDADDKLGDEKHRVAAGGIIKFDEGVKVRIYFVEKMEIKKIFTDSTYSKIVGTNIKINYMLIETILKVLKKFNETTKSQFFIKKAVFEGAKKGDIYLNYSIRNEVDSQIEHAAKETGISEAVFMGEQRIYTGFKLTKLEKAKLKAMSVKSKSEEFRHIDELTTELMEHSENTLQTVFDDPLNYLYYLNYEDDEVYLDLEKLISYVVVDVKKKIKDKEVKKQGLELVSKKDKYKCPIKYGNALKSIIEKISKYL